jgi:hypothetical protein
VSPQQQPLQPISYSPISDRKHSLPYDPYHPRTTRSIAPIRKLETSHWQPHQPPQDYVRQPEYNQNQHSSTYGYTNYSQPSHGNNEPWFGNRNFNGANDYSGYRHQSSFGHFSESSRYSPTYQTHRRQSSYGGPSHPSQYFTNDCSQRQPPMNHSFGYEHQSYARPPPHHHSGYRRMSMGHSVGHSSDYRNREPNMYQTPLPANRTMIQPSMNQRYSEGPLRHSSSGSVYNALPSFNSRNTDRMPILPSGIQHSQEFYDSSRCHAESSVPFERPSPLLQLPTSVSAPSQSSISALIEKPEGQ